MEDLFAHPWARLDRSIEVAERMMETWNKYLGSQPFSNSLRGDGAGVFILRIHEDRAPPQEFAVATGEWINHLRSALDYTIWATACHVSGHLPPPNEAQIQYPIYETQAAWDRNVYRLSALAEHHRMMLRAMQPFNTDADANFLTWVNRIARSDRHRQLSRMTAYVAEAYPAVAAPRGTSVSLQWGDRLIRHSEAALARIVVSPWDPGMQVAANPRAGIDPEIEEWSGSPFWRRMPFPKRVRWLGTFVASHIATFEYDCTGSSRESELLSSSYREACRARSHSLTRPVRARGDVVWGPAQPADRTTRAEADGRDFPAHWTALAPERPDGNG